MRLTIEKKQQIREKVFQANFSKLEKQLKGNKEALALRVYSRVFTERDIDLMKSLPDGYLPSVGYVNISTGSRYSQLPLKVQAPTTYEKQYIGFYAAPDSEIGLWFEKNVTNLSVKIKFKKAKLNNALDPLLNSVNTWKQLKELWPEVTKYIDLEVKQESSTALIPSVSTLNELLSGDGDGN